MLTIVLIAMVVFVSGQNNFVVLFAGLTDEEAGAVYEALKEIPVEIKSEPNGTILVPAGQKEDIRNQLSAQGIIPTGSAGANNYGSLYLDKGLSFGATDKDKELIDQFQMQTDLTGLINKLEKVESNTVLLNVAPSTQYAIDSNGVKKSTATVMVVVKNGQSFTEEDAAAIKQIVAGTVPRMNPEDVVVVDQANNIYGSEGVEGGSGSVANQIKLEQQTANLMKNQMVSLFSPVFGMENLSAMVNVKLDFDKKSTESITLEPPTDTGADENKGIITSSKQMAELMYGEDAAEGEPGMDPNGGAPTYDEVIGNIDNTDYYTIQEEYNYEVNEVKELIENAQGDITTISATMLINGGDEIADIVEDVRNQAATALGIPAENITIAPMAFAESTLMQQQMEEQKVAVEAMQRNALIQQIIQYGAIIGVILLVVVLILNAIKKKKEMELEAQRLQWMREQAEREANAPLVDMVADEELNLDNILDQETNGTLSQLQSLVQKKPEAIAQILKNWLMDDYRR